MHRRQSIQWLEEAIALGGNPQKMAEWIQTGLVKEPIRETLLYFVELQKLIDQKNLPTNIARNALENAQRDGTQPVEMARKWLSTLNDDETLIRQTVRSVLAEHPTHLCRFLAGEKALLDFFMGRIMAQHVGFGNVDPRVVRRVLMNEMEKK